MDPFNNSHQNTKEEDRNTENFHDFLHLHEPQSTARRAQPGVSPRCGNIRWKRGMIRCLTHATPGTSLPSQHPTRQQEEEKQVRGEVRRRRSESEESRIAL
eukprot:TRINITY_DN816_c0_g1_i1.p1 TRINITY_DN816_c0_g1~~TRINITY_DN816_c0_g1_i1.p1  ORF type:complete len:101 (-),score=22.26 TRINITY_DN816_c0_g1_i1:409-711(-)